LFVVEGGGVLGYRVSLFLGRSKGKLAFQLVTVFPSSSFLAFSRILWDRAFLKVSSSGAVGLGHARVSVIGVSGFLSYSSH